jgi:hypothetical protein
MLMIQNPITIDGYLHSWQFVTSVQDDTCISYDSVWRLKSSSEFVRLQDSEIRLQPSDYENKKHYIQNITNKIVRVKYGDILSVYVDQYHYHIRGCKTLLFSSRQGRLEDETALHFNNNRAHAPTQLSLKTSKNWIVDHRALALQAFVQGMFALTYK